MNTKKIKKLNIKVKVKPRPNLTNSEAENSAPQTPVKVTGFERTVYGDTFWYNSIYGSIVRDTETKGCGDNQMFETANYYTNEDLAEWCNCSDALNRKMRRWAAERNGEKINWEDEKQPKFFIFYNRPFHHCSIDYIYQQDVNNNVYFDTYDNAVLAMNVFGNEIKWLAENRPEWF